MDLQQNEQPQPLPSSQPKKSHKKLALLLLLGPTALLLLAIFLYAIANLITNSSQPPAASEELFMETNPMTTILNILLFITGTVGVIAWLPGIVIGLILLGKHKYAQD